MPPRKTRLYSAIVLFGAALTASGCEDEPPPPEDFARVFDLAGPDLRVCPDTSPVPGPCGEMGGGEMGTSICCFPLIL